MSSFRMCGVHLLISAWLSLKQSFLLLLAGDFFSNIKCRFENKEPKKKEKANEINFRNVRSDVVVFFDVNRNIFYLFSFISPTRLRFQSKSTVPFCQLCQLNSKSRLYFNYELFKNVRGRKKTAFIVANFNDCIAQMTPNKMFSTDRLIGRLSGLLLN